jgi:hypothetical protein
MFFHSNGALLRKLPPGMAPAALFVEIVRDKPK